MSIFDHTVTDHDPEAVWHVLYTISEKKEKVMGTDVMKKRNSVSGAYHVAAMVLSMMVNSLYNIY